MGKWDRDMVRTEVSTCKCGEWMKVGAFWTSTCVESGWISSFVISIKISESLKNEKLMFQRILSPPCAVQYVWLHLSRFCRFRINCLPRTIGRHNVSRSVSFSPLRRSWTARCSKKTWRRTCWWSRRCAGVGKCRRRCAGAGKCTKV